MPLVGFIDPSHEERKSAKWGRKPNWYTIDDLLEMSLRKGPKWSPWSYEMIQLVLRHHQERDYISTSMLTGGCMRGNVIERREDYVDDLASRYASSMGTALHKQLETVARPNALVEWRFFTSIDGLEFSCSPDFIDPDLGLLADYKRTENPPDWYPYRHHKEQVNLNRWVTNHATRWLSPGTKDGELQDPIPVDPRTIDFKMLTVVYLAPKGPMTLLIEETEEFKTPNNRIEKRKVPQVWSDKEVRKWLDPRLEAMEQALASYPEWPEGLETYPGWEGPADWRCPGIPLCYLPGCMAKRYPDGFTW